MPYKEGKKKWRAKVQTGGQRHTALLSTRRAALDWENAKRKELAAPPKAPTHTGSLLRVATEYLDYCERTFNPTTFRNKRKALKDQVEAVDYRVLDVLHTLRSSFDSGKIDATGVQFHDTCLTKVRSLRASNGGIDNSVFPSYVAGCMYEITARCRHRFTRFQL